MTNRENKSEFDQELANIRDTLPSLYWALYTGCLEKGFTSAQAMQIVIASIMKPT